MSGLLLIYPLIFNFPLKEPPNILSLAFWGPS